MNRYEKIASVLEAENLDAVLLTGEANRFYASGFFVPGTDATVLVTGQDAVFFTDARYTEAAARCLDGAELREVKPGKSLTDQLRELVFLKGVRRLGFEDGAMTVQSFRRLEKALSEGKSPCELTAASEPVSKLRQTKDPAELAAMETAQGIAERALEDILKEIRPGVTEKEIAARLQYLMLHYGASDMSFDPIVVSGPNGSLPHGVPSEKEIQAGEFVTMDFGCIYGGYCSDMTRTVAVGSVTEEMERVYKTVLSAQEAGIAAAKAGVPGKAVDAAARAVIEEAGYGEYFTHSFGHGVGVEIHEAPNAAASNEKPLPAGAVISAEPGIYIPGKLGVRIEDVILITPEGCRNLTKAPKELMVI
ncbi:Xaa-Pro peptidase family protein [uncultured Oscillibacter sp.]|uniref:M24 family metallopeptidase n=1 Tax=uncultured Oscillibacter sp. TaxID=876091 RepID=UPI00272DFBDC|nr:Xaa-Pro peptidase family protein [uncultured Oscillibacter sp.]